MEETLRKEVRTLTTRLGAIVEEQCGRDVFRAIETLRQLSKQIRQQPSTDLVEANDRAVAGLLLEEATEVAHAFSLFFHLVNLCEERERIRRLAAYERHDAGAPMSVRRAFTELRRKHVAAESVKRLLHSMQIEPVLTAHPTEAKRRSVFNHILRIGQTLDTAAGEAPTYRSEAGAPLDRKIDPWIEALWLTDEVRERPVTLGIEIENTLVYFERTIYDLAGSFWQQFVDELRRAYPKLDPPPPFFRFGSWVGTDRDGNPNVTPEASLEAAELHRQSVLHYYLRTCQRLLGVISFPCRKPACARRIERDLSQSVGRFPALRVFERADQPHEYYRRKLRMMIWRLERTLERAHGQYDAPPEFVEDARLLEDLLAGHPSPRIASLGPRHLRVAAEAFGFHGASHDFRQHASLTRAAAEELLGAAGLPAKPEGERIHSIRRLLSASAALPEPVTIAVQRTIDEFGTLAEIQRRYSSSAAHRYILSMSTCAADVWDVLLLAAKAGLVEAAGSRLKSHIDIAPLFETYDDLIRCPDILDQLLSDPVYRRLLHSRGDFQEIMLGYSDSVKDSGYVAANWALFRAQEGLENVARRHSVKLGLFHGKGGTIDRGGGMSYRSVQAQPHAAPGGRLRITEQGEVISFKYSNPVIARRNLEQLASSVLAASLLHPKRIPKATLAGWRESAQELAESSRAFYRDLVYETPEFPQYFFQATPIDLIEQLRLGSRPSRRFRSRDVQDLRAIPWVFAWTQSRHFLPSWYGAGFAFDDFIRRRRPRGLPQLRKMYREWPFFSVLVDNAEVSLAKTDLYIAGRYARLVGPPEVREKIFGRIQEEYERTVKRVLEIREGHRLLEKQPVLAESIRLRNPYVDPLNFLQLRFLERWRRDGNAPPELLHLLQITVGGIAFGMKSTG